MAATKAEYKGVEEDEKKPRFASEREAPFVVHIQVNFKVLR